MATSQKIVIDPHDTGLWKVKQTDEAAKKASELLQHDLQASTTPPPSFVHTRQILTNPPPYRITTSSSMIWVSTTMQVYTRHTRHNPFHSHRANFD